MSIHVGLLLVTHTATPRAHTQADAVWTIADVTGRVVRVADADGDGGDDLVLERGSLREKSAAIDLVSSRDGALIRPLWRGTQETEPAHCWDAGGDLNGDGASDLLVGVPTFDHARGLVVAVSGKDGRILFRCTGDETGDWFGTSVAILPDVDCDGRDEWVVGAPRLDVTLLAQHGWAVDPAILEQTARAEAPDLEHTHVTRMRHEHSVLPGLVSVRSGSTGVELARREGALVGDAFGTHVYACADMDRDGCADVLAQHDQVSLKRPTLLSGRTGQRIETDLPIDITTHPAGDVDGDGRPDAIRGRGTAEVRDIASGRIVATFPAMRAWFPPELATARVLHDLDADGCPEIAVTEPHFNLLSPGERGFVGPATDVTSMNLATALGVESEAWHGGHLSGVAVVFSGRTREPIFGVWGLPEVKKGLGLDVVVLPDVSGDGFADVLVTDEDTAFVFAGPGPSQ